MNWVSPIKDDETLNNLMDALLSYPDAVDSWAVLRDNWSAAIDVEIEKYNAALES